MPETINMPKLGFDMAEGTLIRWVKQVGENINKGDVLAEIETDKATVEVESPASGVVLQHMVDQGSVVPVNAPIAVVGNAGEKVDAPSAAPQKTESKPEEKPAEQAADTGQPAPKADEKPAPPATPEAASSPQTAPTTPAQATPQPESPAPAAAEGDGHVKVSPLAKKIARDNKLDLSHVQGTGPGGRVVRKDVEAALSSPQPSAASRPSTPSASAQVNVTQEDQVIQTTKLRQAIGRRLVEAKQTIPHFYVTHEYKMDALMAMRKQANEYLPDNEKLSVNDFILKAVAL